MNGSPAHTTWTIDAIEEGIVALEADGKLLHLPLALLPAGVREGDVLVVDREEQADASTLRIRIDRAATEVALQRSRDQLRAVRPANDPGGDIVL
jgi:hypothetical protein